MRALSIVAANKYTGAAAIAEHFTRSLHRAGVEAHLLFVGGHNLAERLRGRSWAHPRLHKERAFGHLRDNLGAIRELAAPSQVVLSYLPHDHLLCVAAGAHRRARLVRVFRNSGHFRRDPYHRFLARRLHGAVLAHSGMNQALYRLCGASPALVLPVPVDDRFAPGLDGRGWRNRTGIPAEAPVLGMVGKLARGRGFDLMLEAAARASLPVHCLLVGHGEDQPRLERLARRLGLSDRVRWVGYQEEGLPDLYAAMDAVLFTAAGSDHGHRVITEAQSCARPVVAAALPGVEDLIEDGRTGRIVASDAAALATAVDEILGDPPAAARQAAAGVRAAEARRFEPSGRQLAEFLERVVALGGRPP